MQDTAAAEDSNVVDQHIVRSERFECVIRSCLAVGRAGNVSREDQRLATLSRTYVLVFRGRDLQDGQVALRRLPPAPTAPRWPYLIRHLALWAGSGNERHFSSESGREGSQRVLSLPSTRDRGHTIRRLRPSPRGSQPVSRCPLRSTRVAWAWPIRSLRGGTRSTTWPSVSSC